MNGRRSRFLAMLACVVCAASGCRDGAGSLALRPVWAPSESDDAWTILLCTFRDPEMHVKDALYYKEQCGKHTGWQGLFVVHKADHSEFFWGKYATVEAAAKNLKTARQYVSPAGARVFEGAVAVPLPGKDFGPPEWNLVTAKGEYSVVVAIFYDVPERNYVGRKRFAVDYCRQLREEGLEAYYYHDPGKSAVAVGTFDDKAVEMTREGGQPKPVVVDERMRQVLARFPLLAVNGRAERIRTGDRVTRKPVEMDVPSYPARIPKKKGPDSADSLDHIGDAKPRQGP